MDLSIIIVNYNGHPYLYDCLHSLREAVGTSCCFETILIDNASTDQSVQTVHSRFPWVQIIQNSENLGFARANNQAIKLSRGEHVLLLNPDTVVLPKAVSILRTALIEYSSIGVVGPRLLNPDGSVQPSVVDYPSLYSSLIGFLRSKVYGTSKRVVDDRGGLVSVSALSGAALMVRRSVFQDVGLLDESYYMYGEEIDFCYRARKAGWDVVCATEASIIHLGGRSTHRMNEAMYVERRKGQIRFVLKQRSKFEALLLAMFMEANIILRALLMPAQRQRYHRIHAIFRASVYPMFVVNR